MPTAEEVTEPLPKPFLQTNWTTCLILSNMTWSSLRHTLTKRGLGPRHSSYNLVMSNCCGGHTLDLSGKVKNKRGIAVLLILEGSCGIDGVRRHTLNSLGKVKRAENMARRPRNSISKKRRPLILVAASRVSPRATCHQNRPAVQNPVTTVGVLHQSNFLQKHRRHQ
jgi:hypothetical protein